MRASPDEPWPRYLALELAGEPRRLFGLSPWLMRWEDEAVWLVDLTPCRRYWETLAERAGRSAAALVREVLQRLLGEDLMRAAAAEHPWRALLLLRAMTVRGVGGILDGREPFGKALVDAVAWDAWLAVAKVCGAHLQAARQKRFALQRFAQQCRLLEAAVDRLGARGPQALAGAEAAAFRRRFGSWLGLFWDWTRAVARAPMPSRGLFPSPEREPDHGRDPAFPWLSWLPRAIPQRLRHLDFSLWRWDDLEPLLAEDLAPLSQDARWLPEERVTELSWHLVLSDMSELPVRAAFRHPHDLRKDAASGFRITLLQLSYAFEAAMRAARRRRESEVELPIAAWELTISGRVVSLPIWSDLFGELGEEDGEHVRLLELENALPVALERYALLSDWLPESSFACLVPVEDGLEDWVTLARRRPLFYTSKPAPLASSALRGSRRAFLERVATKWWEAGTVDSGRRDYYQLLDREGRYQWAFRDEHGAWYRHGLFG